MLCTFKYLILLLFALHTSPTLVSTHNYNYSKVHEQALISQSLFLVTRPVPNAYHRTSRPALIQYAELKKYQLKDTHYRVEDQDLSYQDQYLLFNMEPAPGIFSSQQIVIENYRLLELRRFGIEMSNPSSRLKLVIVQITFDRTEIKHQKSSFPLTIYPQSSHQFPFLFYASELNPQHLQCAVYFFVEIYDGTVLAEQKVYARKVAATITPNHLRLQTHIFRSCPRHQTLTIKNYEMFEIGLTIQGHKQIQTIEGTILSGQTKLQPTKSLKILMEGKNNQLMIHTAQKENIPAFPTLLVQTFCEQSVTIDYFNIGILPEEKTVFDFPLTISSNRNDNATINQIVLQSTSETVIFEELPQFSGVIQPLTKYFQIGVIRIFARRYPQRKSTITVRMQVSTALDQFWTEQKFSYKQIRNPIYAGSRRFIDVRKLSQKPERFTLKNNLNLPLFLTRFYCNEYFLQLSWGGERRKIVYPNNQLQQLFFKYVGPTEIPLSPQKHILILEFNGNILIPIEIVVYDQSLQCLLDNLAQKCNSISQIDFGYFRDQSTKGKQIIVRNWNPQALPLSIDPPYTESHHHGVNMSVQIYGPLPGQQPSRRDKNIKDFILKPNHFIVIDFEMELLANGTAALLPFHLVTNCEIIKITLIIRVQNGTIALIPQVVRFESPMEKTIDYLNLVSTYSQKYRIANISTNLSGLIVAIPPHDDIKGNQFVGMTVVFDPFLQQLNTTNSDWSLSKKQSEYNLFIKKRQFQPLLYGQVILKTTTQLSAKSTIIIEKRYKPMIASAIMKDINRGLRGVRYVLSKRKPKATKYGETRQTYQISFELKNNFAQPLRYRPFLVSDFKFSLMNQYFRQHRNIKTENKENVIFCLSQTLKIKLKMPPSTVKEIFNLPNNPEQYTLETSSNEEGNTQVILISKHPKNQTITFLPNDKAYDFLLLLLNRKYKNCMYFQEHQAIARLFQTDLPYKILQEEGEGAFRDFIKSEKHNLYHTNFFQYQIDPHIRSKFYNHKLCWQKQQYSIYSFCDPLKARIQLVTSNSSKVNESANQTYLLLPSQTHKLTVQIFNPFDQSKLYLILANNYTRFQTYQTSISIKNPSIYVKHDYLSPLFSELYEDGWGKWKGANLLPIELYLQDFRVNEDTLEGTRTFQIINEGQGDLIIDHIGIDQKFYSCGQKGIQLFGLTCGADQEQVGSIQKIKRNIKSKYLLKSFGKYNLTIKFLINLKNWPLGKKKMSIQSKQFLKYVIYLYDQKGYHFKLHLLFKISDPHLADSLTLYSSAFSSPSIYGYISIGIISLAIICVSLLKIQQDQNNPMQKNKEKLQITKEDLYMKLCRLRRLGRLLKQNNYGNSKYTTGPAVPKKGFEKCVHKVTEDLLLSAKEVTQRQLKKYFNQSQESAIGVLDVNHHLSLSQSISDPQVLPEQSESKNEDPSVQLYELKDEEKQSSDLPEGEQVDLTGQLEEDSLFDFNKEFNESSKNLTPDFLQQQQQEKFYNIFRSDVGLKKHELSPKTKLPTRRKQQ